MDFWLGLACTHSSPWIFQVLETYSESPGVPEGTRRPETPDTQSLADKNLLDSNHSNKCFGRTSRKKANEIYDCFHLKKHDCLQGLNA